MQETEATMTFQSWSTFLYGVSLFDDLCMAETAMIMFKVIHI